MDDKIKQIDDLICKANIGNTTFEEMHEQIWESSLSDIESEMWEMYQLLRTIRDIVKGAD